MPRKMPRHYLDFVYGCLRLLVPSESRELSSKKLQQFINHYIEEKIWLEEEEKERAFVNSKIAQFTSLERLKLSEYIEVKIKKLKQEEYGIFIKAFISLIILAGFCFILPIQSLLISLLFLVSSSWLAQRCFCLVFSKVKKRSIFESLLLLLQIAERGINK